MNESENTMYIILKDTAKAVMKRKFIAPFVKLFHHPKTETLYPLSIPPHSLLPSASLYFLSLCICLFQVFHISRIIQYMSFCVWHIFIQHNGFKDHFGSFQGSHAIVCIRTLFLFMGEYFVHMVFYQDTWVVSTFWLL